MAVTDAADKKRRLVGCANFVRVNPRSDRFAIDAFHHIEIYAGDATSTAKRFQVGLGMQLVAKSDAASGNTQCTSYVLQSGAFVIIVTAPASMKMARDQCACPIPGYDAAAALQALCKHGVFVRSIGLAVDDASEAHRLSTANGAVSILSPQHAVDAASSQKQTVSEIKAYGDVAIRFVSGSFKGPFLANFEALPPKGPLYGIQRLDHCVGNVEHMFETIDYLMQAIGLHEFAEFTAEDVGTVDSGLNSMVLASNNELVLLPVNEPTHGTKRQSQIQTYLDFNEGPGVQHLALKTDDIFTTLRQMRAATDCGGMEFMPKASDEYYRTLPERIGDALTPAQLKMAQDLGVLVDKDDQGVLLQIFTKPIGDRPTLFFEIIQRVGCETVVQKTESDGRVFEVVEQAGGCGGFGKGNFRELFKSIERYEEAELGV